MTLSFKHILGATLALLVLCSAAGAVTARREANGAIRYYDDNGNDRGYAWCMKRGGRAFSGWSDCRYSSYEQCRASIVPFGGDCEPNAFSYYVQTPPAAQPRRR